MNILSEIIKKTERGVPHMFAPRRGSLFLVIEKFIVMSEKDGSEMNQNRHITYYIFHIKYSNSKISIGLL